jgi:hypothetical protein
MANDPRPCLNLRTKDMFYKDPASHDPEHEALIERLYGRVENKAFWCHCTQAGRGPDDQPVNRAECSRSDRKCYKGLEHLA